MTDVLILLSGKTLVVSRRNAGKCVKVSLLATIRYRGQDYRREGGQQHVPYPVTRSLHWETQPPSNKGGGAM